MSGSRMDNEDSNNVENVSNDTITIQDIFKDEISKYFYCFYGLPPTCIYFFKKFNIFFI